MKLLKERWRKFLGEGDVVDLGRHRQLGAKQTFVVLSDGETYDADLEGIFVLSVDPQKVPEEYLDAIEEGELRDLMRALMDTQVPGLSLVSVADLLRR